MLPLSMTVPGPVVTEPFDSAPGRRLRYGLATIWQVSPTEIAVQVNRRPCCIPVVDLEDGSDLFVTDRIEGLKTARPQPLLRNREGVHPRSGAPLILVHYPVTGGFVPLGAKRADGTPHPHAGTGFGVGVVLGYPADHSVARPEGAGDVHQYLVLQQYRYDGARFEVQVSADIPCDELLPGWWLHRHALGPAVADGDDLLFAHVTRRDGGPAVPGVARWRRGANGWAPDDYQVAGGIENVCEPSLVRDTDGALLMAVRPLTWEVADHFTVLRSADGGRTWELRVNDPAMRAHSPVVLAATANGHPVLFANPLRRTCIRGDGTMLHAAWMREDLHAFPLTDDRRHVQTPSVLLDARQRLGPARQKEGGHPNFWYLDHPIAGTFRLGDGAWHVLVPFRVGELWEVCTDAPPTEASGCWIGELHGDDDAPRPPWVF